MNSGGRWFNSGLGRLVSTGIVCAFLVSSVSHSQTSSPSQAATVTTSAQAKIALIHFNPKLRDLNTNIANLTDRIREAFANGANIVVTPELSTTGYSITGDQVSKGLGIKSPFKELNQIQMLAGNYRGYVFIGIAELAADGKLYNSVAVFGPTGLITVERKRGIATWNVRGDVPFITIPTPFGTLGTTICSDIYLPDWMRILTLKGANIVITPANWWGESGQEEVWQTRAREDGVWLIVTNRWGNEVDDRYNPPFTYDMNDARSEVISPQGKVVLSYRAKDSANPSDKILYYTIDLSKGRPTAPERRVFTIAQREPQAYAALSNVYFRPDMDNQPFPGLPAPGKNRVAALAYKPSPNFENNLATLRKLWNSGRADFLVLPGLGITATAIDAGKSTWFETGKWPLLQKFVDDNGISLLATSVLESQTRQELLVIFQRKKRPELISQVHSPISESRSLRQVWLTNLQNMRVAVVSGKDFLFPEFATELAKEGMDLVLVTSTLGTASSFQSDSDARETWTQEALLEAWDTATNNGFHLAAADGGGFGLVVHNNGGFIESKDLLSVAKPSVFAELDSQAVRSKHLNAYYFQDLETLLTPTTATPKVR